MKVSASAVALILCVFATFSFAKVDPEAAPRHYNYRDASKQMRRIYYGELQETIYCGCRYLASNGNTSSPPTTWVSTFPAGTTAAVRTVAQTTPRSRSWKATFTTSTPPSAK